LELHPPTALAELERLVSNAIDPELESWRALRKRFAYDDCSGLVVPVRRVAGSSFLTGTQTELIYTNSLSGTAKNTWTAEAGPLNDEAGMGPQANLPPYFFPAGSGGPAIGKAIRICVRGLVSTTVTPTFTFTVRAGASGTAGPIIGGNPSAITSTSGAASQVWELEFDLILRALGTTAGTATVQGLGLVQSPGGLVASAGCNVFGGAATPGTVATFNITTTNFINVNAACSPSSVSNGLTVLQLLVVGLN
jgi:hypothetical protein